MASSGIPVDPECKLVFDDLKLKKKYKYIVYRIIDQKISVVKTSTNSEYAELTKDLPANECCWVVYDANYELTDGGKRQKICLISWVPDNARDSKDKMRYSTSKADFRRVLIGEGAFPLEIQATDADEADQATMEFKLQGKLI